MKAAILDLETTGLKFEKGDIIETCYWIIDTETNKLLKKFNKRNSPTFRIEKKAEDIHGISMNDVKDLPEFSEYADEVTNDLNSCDVLVAHNAEFDYNFLNGVLKRLKKKPVRTPSFCTMQNGRWAGFDGSLPSLQQLCFACGFEYDKNKAHAAEYDVGRTTLCFLFGLKSGWYLI